MSDVIERIAALPPDKRQALIRELQKTRNEAGDTSCDVVILGGGMAGLTLALQIKQARPETSILVLEKQAHPVPEAAHKVGESTVEICAHYLRDILGLDEHLQTQQLRKFGLRMFFNHGDNRDIARRVEIGSTVFPPLCTYQLDRGRLENMLGDKLPMQGIRFLDGCKVQQIELRPEQSTHQVRFTRAGADQTVTARWVVDASGP